MAVHQSNLQTPMVLEGSLNYGPPVFVRKVSGEHSHARSLKSRLWLLSSSKSRAETVTETIGPAKPKIFIIWPFTEKVGRLLTSYPYSQTRKKKSTQIWKFTYLTSLAQGQVWAALTAPCVKARPLSSAAAAEAGVHPAPQRCHPPQVPARPGPRCTLAAPTGPPWTPSTASSPPTQETAPGSSPTFNPRVPSSSSTSHRRGSGCPYSTPCAPSSVRAGGWQCPGVEDTNPPPGAQRSRRPADSLAVTGLPPERPRSERGAPLATAARGPARAPLLTGCGEPRRRWTGGKPSSAGDTEVGNFSKSGSGRSGVLPAAMGWIHAQKP